jgi:hypothetical protein
MKKNQEIKWLEEPEAIDYPAAASFLSLIFDGKRVKGMVNELKVAPLVQFKSKDIFRASGLPLLGTSNSHVEKDRDKIRAGHKLSPILLVRNPDLGKVIVADGYHRLCAVYTFNEDAIIPCKIV